MSNRPVKRVVQAKPTLERAGVHLRRAFGFGNTSDFDPLQGDDDQLIHYKDASLLQAKLLKNSTLKIYPGYPHGMMTTRADVINTDILAFTKGAAVKAA